MKNRDAAEIRVENLCAIWNVLQGEGAWTRQKIAEATGLSLMSISNLVDILWRAGAVEVLPPLQQETHGAGRRAEVIRVNTAQHLWLVIDLTDRSFRYSLVRLNRQAESVSEAWRYDAAQTYEANYRQFLRACFEQVRDALARSCGVALITPGPYDPDTDTIVNARIPEMNDIRLKESVQEIFGCEVIYVDEDVKFAARAYAELLQEPDGLYYLYIGEGVGGALVWNGRLFTGCNATAGDPSLLPPRDGLTCEDRISLRAFARKLGIDADRADGAALLRILAEKASAAPETYAAALVETAAEAAEILAVVSAMLDPRVVVVDCVYAQPMRTALEESLKEYVAALPLRRKPALCMAAQSMPAPCFGAVKAMEKSWIRGMK